MSQNYLFQAVGAFFVNKYYYILYSSAKSNVTNGTVTDTYTANLREFCSGIKNMEQCYRRVADDLHKYCKRSPRFSNLLYSEFIDRFMESFVPDDYFEVLTRDNKEEIFCRVITELATRLANFSIRSDNLRKIVDNHEENKNLMTSMLFNESQSILQTQKDVIIHSFISTINTTQDTVSLDLYNSLRKDLRELEQNYEELKETYSSVLTELNESKVQNNKLRRFVELLQKTQIVLNKKTASITAVPAPAPAPAPVCSDFITSTNVPPIESPRKSEPSIATVDKDNIVEAAGGFIDFD